MSKDDFNSKVGKSALDGLLNRKKPEPEPVSTYEPYDRYPTGTAFGGYDDDPFATRGRSFEPSYQRANEVKSSTPKWLQGKSTSARKGDVSGHLKFDQDGKFAVVGENAVRNVKVAIRTKVLDELRVRGVHVKLGEDHVIDQFIEGLLLGGTCQVKRKQGAGFLTIKSDDLIDESSDNLEFDFPL